MATISPARRTPPLGRRLSAAATTRPEEQWEKRREASDRQKAGGEKTLVKHQISTL